eukprot:CAMPEP_0117652214 /NCGR_PEP_ID=MMETSP0804-20121206/2508_1 /TAXON_ID=1074897 /ORGANISM="Tetraselmis astigmatica, Strain CCMP880" /LENGTH=260 /DNA_ID=CAMNT_0005458247 /DNA_START=79 /DNA_END=861 /DNA_ORIENTATION=+
MASRQPHGIGPACAAGCTLPAVLLSGPFTRRRTWQAVLPAVRASPSEDMPGPGAAQGPQDEQLKRSSQLQEVLAMCDDQGIRYLVADDEEEEAWDDILEDMDDPWMREPTAAPEILEQQAAEVAAAAGGAGAVSQAEPSFAYSKDGGFVDIGVPELIELMNKRLEPLQVQAPACTVIDVRSSMEFSLRKLPSSINIPVKQLTRDAVSGFTTAAVVVVVGSGDDRSRQAVVRLTKVYRFTDVRHFEGGVPAWEEHHSKGSS